MPGDTLHINNKAKVQNTYDAIIVGSGISGGWAAKELCEKGLRVLMLERGRPLVHPDYPTATKDPWDFTHRNDLTSEDKKKHFIQDRHFSIREDNKHFYINDEENRYTEVKRFDWIRGDIVGGRSVLWGRACYRWSDVHFEANLKDGIGADWPIRYKDISKWYDYVESFIGVSGNADGISHLPDGIYQPPFDMNVAEKHFKQQIESKYNDRKVIIGRVANLTRPVKSRGQCMVRNLCHRGCPYGAYFSTNASTLPAAFATGLLTLRPYSLVSRVIWDEKKQLASGVEIIDTETKQTKVFYSRIVFLNASTVATAFILLNSVSSRFPNGLGNDSDQVGRNLMDHHKGISISGKVEGFEDMYYYGRRPIGIYIPQFRNIDKKIRDFMRGYLFISGASRGRQQPANGIGADFKESLLEPGPWRISLSPYGECLPYSDNRITLNRQITDTWGLPMIRIDCEFKENEKTMQKDMAAAGAEMLETAGIKDVRVSGTMSFPGNANHEMGTARMGHDSKTSVLNAFNQMHDVPNVFITDGSCMASGSCLNPSLTYMALTARACDYAVKEMVKMNI